MQHCLPSRSLRSFAMGIGALFLVIANTPIASAYGYVPYDTGIDAQGFQCHHWNNWGQCSDWSSYDLRALPGSVFSGITSRSVERCNSPRLDCTGRVSVRVRPIPTTPSRGNIVTYTLYIRNDDSQVRSVYVRANLDPNMSFESASDSGRNDSRLVHWDNMQMEPWSSKMLVLRARVGDDAPYQAQLRLTVQAGSSADTAVITVEDTGIEDRARYLVGTQYYPEGVVRAPFIRKPNHDNRNFYYDLDNIRQFRVYGRTESNYPFSRDNYCDPRYYSCEKRP